MSESNLARSGHQVADLRGLVQRLDEDLPLVPVAVDYKLNVFTPAVL
jgi:hypothetical protein